MMKPIDRNVLSKAIKNLLGNDIAGMKALIIDDDPDAREMLGRILGNDGFITDTAENGKEGLEKLEEGLDLIILDLSMPVMDTNSNNFNAIYETAASSFSRVWKSTTPKSNARDRARGLR